MSTSTTTVTDENGDLITQTTTTQTTTTATNANGELITETSTSLGEISTSFGEEASVSGMHSTSSSTTTTTLHDFQVVYSGVDNNAESAGVPWSLFLGTILGLLFLWALTTSAAVMVWCRYDKLRRTIRSERFSDFSASSDDG